MRIAIIGGGAAGLMAAAAIIEHAPDHEVLLIEKNDGLGKKVLISGGGRCNVTTGLHDVRTVLSKYPRGGKFLNSAMRAFPPEAVYAWFEDHGVPLKVEEDLRVFPVSDNGHDILDAFQRLFFHAKLTAMLGRDAKKIERKDGRFAITFKDGETVTAHKVILTTGGQAYRHTGSTGDGYAFAEALGHTVTPLAPSLNSFFCREAWPKEISGLSFEKATVRTAFEDRKYSFTGPVLFTHRGITGPAVFALSSLIAFEKYDQVTPASIFVDIRPDETEESLRTTLEASMKENNRKTFINVLDFFMSRALATVICRELGLKEDARGADASKKDLARVAQWLKNVPLTVIARGAGDEFVTAGGVVLDEVDQRTMESKITPGLYFAGEILDIDGFTGGFNLQASWAAGRLAGENAALDA